MTVDSGIERMLTTLLYEGYALYPYTPSATKNATPTPFGIVYPPVYAAGSGYTFDHARMQVVLEPSTLDAAVGGTVVFLETTGERHQGVARRIELGPVPLDELVATGLTIPFAFDVVEGRARLAATLLDRGFVRVSVCVHNTTPVPEGKLNPVRLPKDVELYNAIAKKVMDENKIPIDDLFALAQPQLGEIQQPANVHFSAKGSQALAEQVAAKIIDALK